MNCKTCGGPLIQKSRARLWIAGILMIGTLAAAPFVSWLWVPAIVLALAGGYLIVWASVGRGLWCRACKRAPLP